jgi:hypothetical protein
VIVVDASIAAEILLGRLTRSSGHSARIEFIE